MKVWIFQIRQIVLSDLRARYRGSRLGLAWPFVQPLAWVFAMTLVLNRVGDVNSGTTPYPIFALTSMSLWLAFATPLLQASRAFDSASPWLRNFPISPLVVVFGKCAAAFFDTLPALLVALFFALLSGSVQNSHAILLFVGASALLFLLGSSLGYLLGVLSVYWRDLSIGLPYCLNFLLLATPVFYRSSETFGAHRTVSSFSPLALLIDSGRSFLLHANESSQSFSLLALLFGVVLISSGSVFLATLKSKEVRDRLC